MTWVASGHAVREQEQRTFWLDACDGRRLDGKVHVHVPDSFVRQDRQRCARSVCKPDRLLVGRVLLEAGPNNHTRNELVVVGLQTTY
jgi:hypothetical protein